MGLENSFELKKEETHEDTWPRELALERRIGFLEGRELTSWSVDKESRSIVLTFPNDARLTIPVRDFEGIKVDLKSEDEQALESK